VTAVTLNLEPLTNTLTREQFYELCHANQDIQLERSPKGELIIVPAVGGLSGKSEADLLSPLWNWNQQTQLGVVFSSSTVFSLPNGGDRAPDVAWVTKERWEALTLEEQEKFPPLCPDFVIELRSRTDRLQTLQDKMQEYLVSGLRLGWLINPQSKQVEIYRPQQTVELLQYPILLSGEEVLPGFSLKIP
jgi:Uma2 family endonuclease